jgi:hypothetical protein
MIVDTYFLPNMTFPELRDMIGSDALDPLRAFSEACREELAVLIHQAGDLSWRI